jgi:glyoxylase-like metal-dependent hydrolase (beta-lactamase superfamily II)
MAIGINMPGKIIYTPGHTDDSIGLLLDNGICFVGDAALICSGLWEQDIVEELADLHCAAGGVFLQYEHGREDSDRKAGCNQGRNHC